MVWFHSSSLPPKDSSNYLGYPERVLKEKFGFPMFRGLQKSAISAVMDGKDALILMPTGGGKSLCYQVPALSRPGMALVISPLVALMRDQVDSLRRRGVRAAALVGGDHMALEERIEIETAAAAGALDLLYISPERLGSRRFIDLIAQTPLSLVAIDEAHCACEWGDDFRPDYLLIAERLEQLRPAPRIALTASASLSGRQEIADRLLRENPEILVGQFDRPNLSIELCSRSIDGVEQLAQMLLSRLSLGSAIVYCHSRIETEAVAAGLSDRAIAAASYHAGLDATKRSNVQDDFVAGRYKVVVATSAFGMGIDIPNVATVAHMGLPSGLDAYYQEIGRAGRDGRPAIAWLTWSQSDINRRWKLIHATRDDATLQRRDMAKLETTLSLIEAPICRRNALLARFGEYPPDTCGHCDLCRSGPALRDASATVRSALSIVRSAGEAGLAVLSEALAGTVTDRVAEAGLDTVEPFGTLSDMGKEGARRILRQCIALGLLSVDDGSATARLTERGRQFYFDRQPISLPLPAAAAPVMLRYERIGDGLPAARRALWQRLKDLQGRDRRLTDADIVAIIETDTPPAALPEDLQAKIKALTPPSSKEPIALANGLFD